MLATGHTADAHTLATTTKKQRSIDSINPHNCNMGRRLPVNVSSSNSYISYGCPEDEVVIAIWFYFVNIASFENQKVAVGMAPI